MKVPFLHKRIRFFPDKRQRFAIEVAILTFGIFAIQVVWPDIRFPLVVVLAIASYFLTVWSLKEDIAGVEWITLFILPVSYTVFVAFFYFLLPERWISRLATTVIYAVGLYAILLVENIYNVAAQRSIQLIRAAHSVGFLVSCITVFLAANVIYSLRGPFWLNGLLLTIVSFVLSLSLLWSVKLEKKLITSLILYSLVHALTVGELSLVLSFWPVRNDAFSLLITSVFYSVGGIFMLVNMERLFPQNIREYVLVFVFILLLGFLTTTW